MAITAVWAFKVLDELNGQTGFVECDEALAQELISDGRAQDPRIGGTPLHFIDYTPSQQPEVDPEKARTRPGASREANYDDKQMTPKRTTTTTTRDK